MTNHRAIMGAQNNADWYSMMFQVHGVMYRRSEIAFLAIDPPPPYHSWMTTPDPQARDEQLKLIRQNAYRPRFGVKDAHDCLNLADEGFTELFSASWIFADSIRAADITDWVRISSPTELLRWETAWKQSSPSDKRQFPEPVLDRADVVFWGRIKADGFDAGVVANISKDCVGLSNCFGPNAYPAAATLCSNVSKGELPVVGYESGDDLKSVLDLGFSEVGPLSIWSRS